MLVCINEGRSFWGIPSLGLLGSTARFVLYLNRDIFNSTKIISPFQILYIFIILSMEKNSLTYKENFFHLTYSRSSNAGEWKLVHLDPLQAFPNNINNDLWIYYWPSASKLSTRPSLISYFSTEAIYFSD